MFAHIWTSVAILQHIPTTNVRLNGPTLTPAHGAGLGALLPRKARTLIRRARSPRVAPALFCFVWPLNETRRDRDHHLLSLVPAFPSPQRPPPESSHSSHRPSRTMSRRANNNVRGPTSALTDFLRVRRLRERKLLSTHCVGMCYIGVGNYAHDHSSPCENKESGPRSGPATSWS